MEVKIWKREEIEALAKKCLDGTYDEDEIVDFAFRYFGNADEAEWDHFSEKGLEELSSVLDPIFEVEKKILEEFKAEQAKESPSRKEILDTGFGEESF